MTFRSPKIISAAAVEANPSASADSTTIVEGQASHIRTSSSPIIAERQLLSVSASEDGTFTLSYRGRETPDIDVGASGAEVQAALESLDVIGTVSINEISVGAYDGTYSITFQPEVVDSFLFGQWFTLGNIPELVVNSAEVAPNDLLLPLLLKFKVHHHLPQRYSRHFTTQQVVRQLNMKG